MTAETNFENALKVLQSLAVTEDTQKTAHDFKRVAAELLTYVGNLQQTVKTLEREVYTDRLTGLGNRKEMERRTAPTGTYSLVMFDIDHFKRVNDTYGHDVGDEVLRHIARIVKEDFAWRREDTVIRWGGEEFLIELPGCSANDAARIANKIRTAIASQPVDVIEPVTKNAEKLTITSSFGVATYDPATQETRAGVEKRADVALYAAKGKNEPDGRNRVAIHMGHDNVVVLPRSDALFGARMAPTKPRQAKVRQTKKLAA